MNVIRQTFATIACGLLVGSQISHAGDVIFEEEFGDGLSDRWQVVGLPETDYRVKDGGLEIRAQPDAWGRDLPVIQVFLESGFGESTTASVDVRVLEKFQQDGAFAGLFLIDDDGPDFRITKKRLDGNLVFSPGRYTYRGAGPEHENLDAYEVTYPLASDDAGQVRIIVRGDRYAYAQVGPANKGKYTNGRYLNLFHSAIGKSTKTGFGLAVGGAKPGSDVWVRFDNFRIETSR